MFLREYDEPSVAAAVAGGGRAQSQHGVDGDERDWLTLKTREGAMSWEFVGVLSMMSTCLTAWVA